LIVGFLKVKTDLSPLAMGISTNPAIGAATTDTQNKSAKPVDPAGSQALYRSAPESATSAVSQTSNKPITTNPSNTAAQNASKTVVTTTPNTTVIPVNNPS